MIPLKPGGKEQWIMDIFQGLVCMPVPVENNIWDSLY